MCGQNAYPELALIMLLLSLLFIAMIVPVFSQEMTSQEEPECCEVKTETVKKVEPVKTTKVKTTKCRKCRKKVYGKWREECWCKKEEYWWDDDFWF
jgi:hypothetical protein